MTLPSLWNKNTMSNYQLLVWPLTTLSRNSCATHKPNDQEPGHAGFRGRNPQDVLHHCTIRNADVPFNKFPKPRPSPQVTACLQDTFPLSIKCARQQAKTNQNKRCTHNTRFFFMAVKDSKFNLKTTLKMTTNHDFRFGKIMVEETEWSLRAICSRLHGPNCYTGMTSQSSVPLQATFVPWGTPLTRGR